MEVTEVARQINERISLLSKGRNILKERASAKANAISHYEKTLAITMLKLRNGNIPEFEGEIIGALPATLIEKVAKGICWKEKLEAELATEEYKSAVVGMDSLKSELNGYQSINRHLDNIANE